MAKFLTTANISSIIEDILKSSKKYLYLVSPYLQFSNLLQQRLTELDNKNIPITLVYGKVEMDLNIEFYLQDLSNLELYFLQNLHAKCYANEEMMVVTSMNLYEFSEKNNREFGILLTRQDDIRAYKDGIEEINSMIKCANKEKDRVIIKHENKSIFDNSSSNSYYNSNNNYYANKKTGYCLRCRKEINYNFNHPYCKECFSSWSFWNNIFFEEKFCHSCGNNNLSSMAKPLCEPCFKKS